MKKKNVLNVILERNWGIVVILLFLVITFIFVLVYGENLYIPIHDNLDASLPYYRILDQNHLFWKNGDVPILHGLDRNYFPADLKLYSFLYMLLPTFPAFILGWYLRILISVSGFYCLERVFREDGISEKSVLIRRNLSLICGLLYGIFPSFPIQAISFASLPWLFVLLTLLYKTRKKRYYVLLACYPFFSDFSLFGFFICAYLMLFFVLNWIICRKAAWRMLLSVPVLSAGYILTEWRLFYTVFFVRELSVRDGFVLSTIQGSEIPKALWEAFAISPFHADSLQIWIVLPTCLICCLISIIQKIRKRKVKEILTDRRNWLLIWVFFNAVIYVLNETEGFRTIVSSVFPVLNSFQFDRTIWFNPFLWYFCFFITLVRIRKNVLRNVLWIGAFFVLCGIPTIYSPIIYNVPFIYDSYMDAKGEEKHLSYREFFSEKLFDIIKQDIDYQGEWSAAFGMHPSVLQYNGIATLDGYASFYPMSYKQEFREVIAPELAIDAENRIYYDDWGARAYLFSNEVTYQPERDLGTDEAELVIDADAFRGMDGELIFSRVRITNADSLGLCERGCYTDEDSPYTIYVYQMEKQGK